MSTRITLRGWGYWQENTAFPSTPLRGTIRELQGKKELGAYDEGLFCAVQPDVSFQVGDLDVTPFAIDHDAAQPVAYRVGCGKKQVAVATDLGHYDSYIIDHLQNLDAILLESNHDVRMLETGPYPYPLKRRILGDHGHLSNENAGRLLNCILHDRLKNHSSGPFKQGE